MTTPAFTIIACPHCGVKNRIKTLYEGKIPVCAKCKRHLMTDKEIETHLKYEESLKEFKDFPDLGLR